VSLSPPQPPPSSSAPPHFRVLPTTRGVLLFRTHRVDIPFALIDLVSVFIPVHPQTLPPLPAPKIPKILALSPALTNENTFPFGVFPTLLSCRRPLFLIPSVSPRFFTWFWTRCSDPLAVPFGGFVVCLPPFEKVPFPSGPPRPQSYSPKYFSLSLALTSPHWRFTFFALSPTYICGRKSTGRFGFFFSSCKRFAEPLSIFAPSLSRNFLAVLIVLILGRTKQDFGTLTLPPCSVAFRSLLHSPPKICQAHVLKIFFPPCSECSSRLYSMGLSIRFCFRIDLNPSPFFFSDRRVPIE